MAGKGSFIWYELLTNDAAAATAFYTSVVGWTPQAFGGEGDYTVLNAGERGVGGIMEMPQAMRDGGARPGWLGYIGVADTDATAAEVEKAGGKVHRAPDDIPGVGRFAVCADPQGAAFQLLTPNQQGDMPRMPEGAPGHVGWHELHTTDWEGAFGFYSALFGWAKNEAMDMGAMGTYQLIEEDGQRFGAMFNSPGVPHPVWMFYFGVPSIEGAIPKITAGGGQVAMGPHQVPGGGWIVQASDPEGVMFALVGGK